MGIHGYHCHIAQSSSMAMAAVPIINFFLKKTFQSLVMEVALPLLIFLLILKVWQW